MADTSPSAPYADAQAQVDASNRAALQQLAATGVSGNAAYQQQIQAGQQAKQQALQGVLKSAAFSGPAAGDAAPYAGMVGQAFDQRLGTTGDLQAAFNSANSIREQGANTFFKEASAALPVIQAREGERQATARDKALKAAADKVVTPGKYVSSLGGETLAGADLAQPSEYLATSGLGAANAIAALAANRGLTGSTPLGNAGGTPNYAGLNQPQTPTVAQITEAAQNPSVTQGTPLTPAQAAVLVQKYEQGLPQNAAPKAPSAAQIRGAADYEPAIKTAADLLKPPAVGGKTPPPASIGDAVAAVMSQFKVSQYVAENIVNDAIVRISKTGTLANSTVTGP